MVANVRLPILLRQIELVRVERWRPAHARHARHARDDAQQTQADASGVPSGRVLTVKDIDDDRLFFATPSGSRKGLDIAAKPHVAAHLHWPVAGWQVRIVGAAGRPPPPGRVPQRHRPGPLAPRTAVAMT
jgi:pyridoxine/pyridoxamine 5'-phosphate oxidase